MLTKFVIRANKPTDIM